jgi:PadR family transcriptional regulator PadR
MEQDVVEDWEKRWRKAVLPFAILAVLRRGPKHGYGLATELRDLLGAAAPEGTLYPLLNGFERDGLTVAEWVIQDTGPARKTYALTDKGRAALDDGARRWSVFGTNLQRLIK